MFQLPEDDRQLLLRLARSAVDAHLQGIPLSLPAIDSGFLSQPHGVFVSIHRGEELRGCVGNMSPAQPLYQTTARCAAAAATEDPRFPALSLQELPEVSFELSILTIPERVVRFDEIEVGEHGLIVSYGAARGLLLPQVATQYGWNRNQFLAETCIKAGLHPNAWKEGAVVHSFTAHVFAEERSPQSVRS